MPVCDGTVLLHRPEEWGPATATCQTCGWTRTARTAATVQIEAVHHEPPKRASTPTAAAQEWVDSIKEELDQIAI